MLMLLVPAAHLGPTGVENTLPLNYLKNGTQPRVQEIPLLLL